MFEGLPWLRELLLDGNRIGDLESGTLSNLPSLTDLDLTSNTLTTFSIDVFNQDVFNKDQLSFLENLEYPIVLNVKAIVTFGLLKGQMVLGLCANTQQLYTF